MDNNEQELTEIQTDLQTPEMQTPDETPDAQETDLSSGENKAGSGAKKKKKVYLELIRALAMLLVIFNHTGNRGFFLFSVSTDSILYPLYLFLSVGCKIAVPLYWMVSGALLLPKEESIKKVYTHRVLRMIIVLVVFSIPYFIINLVNNGQPFGLNSIASFFITLYTDKFASAFWFIYAYIGMMMMLPFLRKLVKAMSKRYFVYLFLMIICFKGVLPILEYLVSTLPARLGASFNTDMKIFSINSNVVINMFTQAVMFFIGGYYFDSVLEKKDLTKKNALKWLGAGFIAIVISCLMTHYMITLTGRMNEGDAQTFYDNLISIPTFAVFYFLRYFLQKHKATGDLKKVILSFGKCAFGIMLCEKALRDYLVIIYDSLEPKISKLPACFVWVLAVYLSGYIITLILKRIPGIKKLI